MAGYLEGGLGLQTHPSPAIGWRAETWRGWGVAYHTRSLKADGSKVGCGEKGRFVSGGFVFAATAGTAFGAATFAVALPAAGTAGHAFVFGENAGRTRGLFNEMLIGMDDAAAFA